MKKLLLLSALLLNSIVHTNDTDLEHLTPPQQFEALFNYAKGQLPLLEKQMQEVAAHKPYDAQKLAQLENTQQVYKVVALIADQDIQGLQNLPAAQLEFAHGKISITDVKNSALAVNFVSEDKKEPTINSINLEFENAVGLAMLNCMIHRDEEKSLDILKAILEKGVNPSSKIDYHILGTSKSGRTFKMYYMLQSTLDLSQHTPEMAQLFVKHTDKMMQ